MKKKSSPNNNGPLTLKQLAQHIAPAVLRSISEEQLLNISLLGDFIAVLLLIIERSPIGSIFAATVRSPARAHLPVILF